MTDNDISIEYYGDMASAGKTLDWHASDHHVTYDENYLHKKHLLEKGGWIDREIEYKFNQYGFRCDGFSKYHNRNPILFLGCSHTVGVGLPIEQTFPYILSKKLNLHYYNLGVSGSSNKTMFRLAHAWIPKLKPCKVIVLYNDVGRTEFADGNNEEFKHFVPTDFSENAKPKINLKYAEWYKSWLTMPVNGRMESSMVMNGIENICRKQNIELYQFNSTTKIFQKMACDWAKDLIHYGPITHEKWAQHIEQTIRSNNESS
jgi:hypothetical protein